jgi:hypothetical protein
MLLVAGSMALLLYIAGFTLNERLRLRRGPWEMSFQARPNGDTEVQIRQPALGIGPVTILFAGEPYTNDVMNVRFDTPRKPVPVGRVKYDELTYLPGVVTLDLFGHELELLPRTLYVNRVPHAWSLSTNLVLTTADRPASLPEPRGKRSANR